MGSASLALLAATPAMAQAIANPAPKQVVAEDNVESVVSTGTLIHGGQVVGVPVTSLSDEDFKTSGAVTIGDVLANIPAVVMIADSNVINGGGYAARDQNINIRNLSLHGDRTLMMVDGISFPNQGTGGCQTDPSIIPQLAVERVDVLTDGASATYGSNAIAGVVNVKLMRGFEGIRVQSQVSTSIDVGGPRFALSGLFGKTWDGGDITVSVEHYTVSHIDGAPKPFWTADYTAYGFDNRQQLVDSRPGIIPYTAGATPILTPTVPANAPVGFYTTSGANKLATLGTICTNCYSVPHGQNGVGLTWAALMNNPGVLNEINNFTDAWESPRQHRDAATLTFDQRIFPWLSLFIDGFANTRPTYNHNSPGGNSFTISVPKSNPYFPTGAPANLTAFNEYIDLQDQVPIQVNTNETASRFDSGFNLTLPNEWFGRAFGAISKVHEYTLTQGSINSKNLSAALGNTVPAVAQANGSTFPGVPAYTKPSNIPYFNPFCDSTTFSNCNDPATLAYITGSNKRDEKIMQTDFGLTFDGPLYTLPAGKVKAAIGAGYDTSTYLDQTTATNSNNAAIPTFTSTDGRRNSISFYGQLDIPVLGDGFNLPLVKKLDIEASIRYDKYDQFGDTRNPKISANWEVGWGLTLYSSWGTSFRAPSFQEAAPSGPSLTNAAANPGVTTDSVGICTTLNVPAAPGTVAAILNPTCSAALNFPAVLQPGSGAAAAALHDGVALQLRPEKGKNLSAGFTFAPRAGDGPLGFLNGLNISATYWYIRITQAIQGEFRLAGFNTGSLNNPNYQSAFITPQNDPNFLAEVTAILSSPYSTSPVSSASLDCSHINDANPATKHGCVQVIADTATKNIGFQALDGVDFNFSYDWLMGNMYGIDLGAWNAGFAGTYNLKNDSQDTATSPLISNFTLNQDSHLQKVRFHVGYRGDFDGGSALSVTAFANYIGHFGPSTNPLPPSCFQTGNAACSTYGSAFSQYTQQSNLTYVVGTVTTFDLSIGYQTGSSPVSDYMKNLRFQITLNNVLDTDPPFQYAIAPPGGGKPHAFYTATNSPEINPNGRIINITMTKDF
jgi:outer membrane receptor protein involved in Fe transport